MGKMKQLLLDILESRADDSEEPLPELVFPNYPIYLTKTATFCNGQPQEENE